MKKETPNSEQLKADRNATDIVQYIDQLKTCLRDHLQYCDYQIISRLAAACLISARLEEIMDALYATDPSPNG
jgi:hypothetical protein